MKERVAAAQVLCRGLFQGHDVANPRHIEHAVATSRAIRREIPRRRPPPQSSGPDPLPGFGGIICFRPSKGACDTSQGGREASRHSRPALGSLAALVQAVIV